LGLAIGISQVAGKAANSIATHLSFGAIGIKNPHAQIAIGLGRESQNQAVTPNAKTSITDAPNPYGIRLRNTNRELPLTTFKN
jgi:hypothetical protein